MEIKMLQEVHIMSKRAGEPWMIRNRLGDLNFRARDERWSQDRLTKEANKMVSRWMAVEPLTEFELSYQ